MNKLVKKPYCIKLLNGGYISKFLKGGVPKYFRLYGIDGLKLIKMFKALKDRGASNQVAFEVSWQATKENPKGLYSFGDYMPNIKAWADDVWNKLLKRKIYRNAVNAKNFDLYRKATYLYNTRPDYTQWLKTGRESGKNFINNYIKENGLGEPIVLIDTDNSINDIIYGNIS